MKSIRFHIANRTPIFLFFMPVVLSLSFTSAVLAESLAVKNDAGLLSVTAEDVLIEQVFREISKKFNVYVKIYPEMKGKKLSGNFQKLPLPEAIKKLVKNNYALVTRRDTIEEIYILSKGHAFQPRNKLIDKFIAGKFPELNELKEIVLRNVRKEHPNARFFSLIPHEDIRGHLESYALCFYLGEGDVPKKEEIERQIKEAWENEKVARDHIETGYKNRDRVVAIRISCTIKAKDKVNAFVKPVCRVGLKG